MNFLRNPRRILPLFALPVLLAQTGCYDWVAIRPADLPLLNGDVQATSEPGQGTAVAGAPTVHRLNGTLLEVHGRHDVRVKVGGQTYLFTAPVHATRSGEAIEVEGGNRPATRIWMPAIDSVEILNPGP
jgi:hypothetical protein